MLLDLMVHSDITRFKFLLTERDIPDCLFPRCRAEESPTASFAYLHQEATLTHAVHQSKAAEAHQVDRRHIHSPSSRFLYHRAPSTEYLIRGVIFNPLGSATHSPTVQHSLTYIVCKGGFQKVKWFVNTALVY